MYNINNYSSIILILANTYNNSTTNTIITNNKIIYHLIQVYYLRFPCLEICGNVVVVKTMFMF